MIRALRDRIWARSRPRLARLVYANGGIGDELMLTAVAHEARLQGKPVHVLSDMQWLWRQNADPLSVQFGIERWHYAVRRGWIPTEIHHLAYDSRKAGRHIAQQMADHLGLTLPADWRPKLAWLSPASTRRPRQVVVQNSCRAARFASPAKEWPQHNWRRLVELLDGFHLLHIGMPEDPPLPGVTDLRGKTSLEDAARLIAESACFIGLESGLMHVAAAAETPSVIVYGGRTAPAQTGYPFHRNVTRQPSCAGCALNEECPNGMLCMDISPEEVAEAAAALAR